MKKTGLGILGKAGLIGLAILLLVTGSLFLFKNKLGFLKKRNTPLTKAGEASTLENPEKEIIVPTHDSNDLIGEEDQDDLQYLDPEPENENFPEETAPENTKADDEFPEDMTSESLDEDALSFVYFIPSSTEKNVLEERSYIPNEPDRSSPSNLVLNIFEILLTDKMSVEHYRDASQHYYVSYDETDGIYNIYISNPGKDLLWMLGSNFVEMYPDPRSNPSDVYYSEEFFEIFFNGLAETVFHNFEFIDEVYIHPYLGSAYDMQDSPQAYYRENRR